MSYESVPEELKALPNWVGWKLETRNDKPTKVPYSSTHELASSTDPKTWRAFSDVCNIPPSKEKGIGFVFDGKGIVGIDIDHCIVDNVVDKKFEHIPKAFDSYTEISPSGTGLHIFIQCSEEPYQTGKKKGDVEIYSKERYFTVTGNVWLNRPINTVPVETVRALLDPFVNPRHAEQPVLQNRPSTSPNLSDDDIIHIASSASNSTKFERLMDGNIGDYANDRSVADMALASMLAFYTTDPNQIERIMRMSGLVREKWDKHQKYLREYTIAKAIQMCNHHFEPKYEMGDLAQGKASADAIMGKPVTKTTTSQSVMEKLTDKEVEEIISASRLCDDLPPFPEITHPFFKKWMVLGNRLMYSHISYHFGNLLAIASMAITRRVSVLIATKYIYPNFDVMLIGTSTISGKSFSSDTAVTEFGIPVTAIKPSIVDPTDTTELKRKSCSNPRLIQDLSKANNMLWYYDESKEFFDDCGDRGWNAPIVGTLCTAYDGGYLERGLSTRSTNKKKSRGEEEDNTEENKWICENPFLTLLFNMTINQIKEASTPKIVGSGFFYRWLWFLENGGEKRKNVTASKEDLQEVKEIRDELLKVGNILKTLRPNDICFRVNDKVEEWSINISKKSDDEIFQSATGRSTIHIYKIAMVLSVFDPEFQKKILNQKEYPIQLELPDKWVDEAITIVEKYLLPRMMLISEYSKKVDMNNKQQRVLDDLKTLRGVVDHTTLLRKTRLEAGDFNKVINTLKESKDIVEVSKNNKRVYCIQKHES